MEKNMERNLLLLVPIVLLALFMLLGNALLSNILPPTLSSKNQVVATCLSESHVSGSIGYSLAANGDRVGLSDGLIPFDLQSNERQDQSDKIRASDLFAQNDATAGAGEWRTAIRQDPTDAEVRIYEEDQSVLSSGLPCVTLAVGVALTGSLREGGRAVLQGAYLAQKEHNNDVRQRGDGTLLRLLIANDGSDDVSTQTVVQRIVKVAQTDRSFVGVMGWDYSAATARAIKMLAQAHLPLVSPTSSGDGLTGYSPYLFRVVPPDTQQITFGVYYLRQLPHQRVAILQDPEDLYSSSLTVAFKNNFGGIYGDANITISNYKRDIPADKMLPIIQQMLDQQPDLIFFSGYASDARSLLIDLQQITSQPGYRQFANIPIMGGDALFELVRYQRQSLPNFSHMHFTAFASPDEWSYLCSHGYTAACHSAFAQRFASDFATCYDPDKKYPENSYGHNLADADTILGYDASMVMLTAYESMAAVNATPEGLRNALAKVNGSRAFQGVSGQISFGLDGNPVGKAIVVVDVDSKSNQPHLVSLEIGDHFLKGT